MKMIKSVALATLTLSVVGCSQPKPIHKEPLKLDCIQSLGSSQKIEKTIIVLKPSIKMLSTGNTQRNDIASQISRLRAGINGGNYNFNNEYSKKYSSTAGNALKNDIIDILENQGFKVNDEYEEYDDIDFSVRKSAYLVIQPEIEASFITNNVNKEKSGNKIVETGNVTLEGNVILKSLEPLSRERISSKKVNLSNLNLSKQYASVQEVNSNNSYSSAFALGTALGNATANALFSSSVEDNTENTLVEIINGMHNDVINKIKSRLQKEVLLAYEPDLKEIKSKKVY